jgi:hypothetical protein
MKFTRDKGGVVVEFWCVDVNFRDIDDRTALHIAAWQGFTQAVSELKQAKLISNIAGAAL